MSRLVAHPIISGCLWRGNLMLMYCNIVQKSSKLNSRPIYCLRLYSTKYNNLLWVYWSLVKRPTNFDLSKKELHSWTDALHEKRNLSQFSCFWEPLSSKMFFWATLFDTLSKQLWLVTFTGYSFWDQLCNC